MDNIKPVSGMYVYYYKINIYDLCVFIKTEIYIC